YSEKVGAGTMNPATVIRVLGPEPWNAAYVEPSYRTDDGRYAENPNRMQMHHQYQVILKPDPGNPQELYLGSLEALGLDRTRHDIRFVEDNWESPMLGAWGLGWEVWLDGQEITQFTYFQQAGSVTLDPVSVEITYGLDRIVMYLQQKTQVWDIDVDGDHNFADLYRSPEIEHCVYNYELADVDRLKRMLDIYHEEAQACIDRGLVIPAHDFVLRQSHTFNLLDSRGAVGVTERAKLFASIRRQSFEASKLYVEQRKNEEYPWLDDDAEEKGTVEVKHPALVEVKPVDVPQSFLFEIGVEELPVHEVANGLEQVEANLATLLKEANLIYGSLAVTGTTRRLVAYVTELVPSQADEVVEKRGPSVDRAFDKDGDPTKAALGFSRGQGVNVKDLEVRDGYIYAVKRVTGRPTMEVLPDICVKLLEGLRWTKTMRWNDSGIGFPRPLRWLTALYGEQVVPFAWAGVLSGRESRKPRYAELTAGSFGTFSTDHSDNYFAQVAAQGIVLNRDERKAQIAQMVVDTAAQVNGAITDEPDLLDEVTDLVESPQALLGSFEERYLALPKPVLIGVMKKHQRYFPILNEDGTMKPHFITIANADQLAHPDVVTRGNEGVIRARYADAAFFYRQDTTQPLADFTPKLSTLTFHQKLGSMLNKVERLQSLATQLATTLGASDAEQTTTERAAALSKSDLVTSMVVEMTSLQGIMGETYALNSGESAEVATAIREHYLPRSSGDDNPATLPGLALSLADKLDSLSGLFAVGAIPTGSADPYGLRRAALGVVFNLLETETDFDVNAGLQEAADLQPIDVPADSVAETTTFVTRRLQGVLLDAGYAHDVVEAVLAVRGGNPYKAQQAAVALAEMVQGAGWDDTFTAYARCARITRNLESTLDLNPSAYTEAVEQVLHDAYIAAQAVIDGTDEPAAVLSAQLDALAGPINNFFDNVMVNAEDEAVRAARLALVQKIAALPAEVADLSKLQGF
ncbi:MAG: glycine--tRNA ligase subunit beta, partial [Chloroflexota bacterium]